MALPVPPPRASTPPTFLADGQRSRFTGETAHAPFVDASPSTSTFTHTFNGVKSSTDSATIATEEFLHDTEVLFEEPDLAREDDFVSDDELKELASIPSTPADPVDAALDLKGGPGSGDFNHPGRPGQQGGAAPGDYSGPDTDHALRGGGSETPATFTPKDPQSLLRESGQYRAEFRKRKLAREILSHSARIKQISEKPFAGLSDRVESRKHIKQMKQKLKDLDIPEDQVWHVLSEMPAQDQAMLASAARLEKTKDSYGRRVAKNIGAFLLSTGAEELGRRFAPPLVTTPDTMAKFTPGETAAWIAAHDSPKRAKDYLVAMRDFNVPEMRRQREAAFRNVISNKHPAAFYEFRRAGGAGMMEQVARDSLAQHRVSSTADRAVRAREDVAGSLDRIRSQLRAGAQIPDMWRRVTAVPEGDDWTRFNMHRESLGLPRVTREEFRQRQRAGQFR